MTGFRSSRRRSFVRRAALLAISTALALPLTAGATGFYGPNVYLDDGGRRIAESPEFFWEREVKRIAHDFPAPEQRRATAEKPLVADGEEQQNDPQSARVAATADADSEDFAAALRDHKIEPPDAAAATAQHDAARKALIMGAAEALPPEFASEFADYHRGALAFAAGEEHWPEARQAWEALLARPVADRHYRSTWAAFMLGKLALKSGDFAQAAKRFEQTRALARDGFADSLGLAADSYGWQGRAEWKSAHPEKAAALFLTQLNLGDASAVVSLKALIPDRTPIDGLLNYGPEVDERQAWDEATARGHEQHELELLQAAARDPLLRRLVTVHILATGHDPFFSEESNRNAAKRASRWLSMIEQAKPAALADAEYLGWLAYSDGKYEQAARWLQLSKSETAAALWLRAKLQRRAGKLDEASQTMALAWQRLRESTALSDSASNGEDDQIPSGATLSFEQWASGDLAGMRLSRAEFVGALDALLRGNLWSDAAFVAERVLTADELKKYVDEHPDAPSPETEPAPLRYLLGRRLVREDRYAEAGAYLPPNYSKVLTDYVAALETGANAKLPKPERAHAYFHAAWIARMQGMEIMGAEGEPDGFQSEGSFEPPTIGKEREQGFYLHVSYDSNGEQQQRRPLVLKPTAQERQRLTKNKVQPDVRFHYRVIAGALAMRAADLLPDNSEELADVLNRAGWWVKDRDNKAADHYFLALKTRAAQTAIGRAALAKRWFTDQLGPWSQAEPEQQPAPEP